ncbi:MAG: glycosyltransferase family 39 protein [Bacteroidetes bacterium]|nr:glycosyltransferase family 39 protein [Bacteroidota bacterium]
MGKKGYQQKPATNQQAKVKVQKPGLKDALDKWCGSHFRLLIALILVFSVGIRIAYFVQLNNSQLINQHKWDESDMFVFDQWADSIAGGDILSERYIQPEHNWMKQIANLFFRDHPERLQYYKTLAGPDTLANSPSKMLWVDWYGKKAFPHEPLYAYFLAFNYKIFGNDVRWIFIWQLLLGVLTNLLVFLVARRYFGEFTGIIAGFLAIFFGPLMFFEMTLLRSTFAVFFTILLVYISGVALQKNTFMWWILVGAVCGLAAAVHAYFILFAVIWFIFLFIYFLNHWKTLGFAVCGCCIGIMAALSPIVIRNIKTGIPPLSLSNNSAIGFITMNNDKFKSFNGWMIEPKYVIDIMYATNGDLIKTIVPTLKTHKSIGSYLEQVWDKFHATFSWYEIPNNVNFYFYREFTPVLYLTFLSFLIISPLALVGLFIAILKRKQVWSLYLMLLVLIVPMLAFMVLSRYRIVFAVVLIPFAAYTIAELFTSWKGWKNIAILASIVIISFWTSQPRNEQTVRIAKLDYAVMLGVHYSDRIQTSVNDKNWKETSRLFDDYITKYQPEAIDNIKPFYRCQDRNEADIWSYFSLIHERRATVFNLEGDTINAKKEADISQKLKEAAN